MYVLKAELKGDMKMDFECRAKSIDNNEWVYGYLFKCWHKSYILRGMINGVPKMQEVLPKTVGRYTGLNTGNKPRDKIFEGDILKGSTKRFLVHYEEERASFMLMKLFKDGNEGELYSMIYCGNWSYIEGNKYDNPELLKQGETT